MKTTFTLSAKEVAKIVMDYLIDEGALEFIDGVYSVATHVELPRGEVGYDAIFTFEEVKNDAQPSE